MVLLSLQGIGKSFVMNRVLSDVTLTLRQGQRMGLIGVNGSGKSTLMKIISGEMAPDEGSVSMMKGARVGLLTQQADILDDLTVWEELARVFDPLKQQEARLRAMEHEMAQSHEDPAMFSRLSGEYERLTARFEADGGYEWPSRIQGVLAGLGFQKDRQDQKAQSLSGGEKTRLCLARILLSQPDLLMLDEPTNHLDLNATAWLEETLKKYRGTVLLNLPRSVFFKRRVRRGRGAFHDPPDPVRGQLRSVHGETGRGARKADEGIRDAAGRDRPAGGDH